MSIKTFIHSKKSAQICTVFLLIGFLVYGIIGRASRSIHSGPPGPEPVDSGWKKGGAVRAKAGLSQTKVLQGSDGLVYMQIDMEALANNSDSPSASVTRKPTDFVIVLDRSGSMSEAQKMDFSKKALHSVVSQLKPDDRFALVTFDSIVETLVPLRTVSESGKSHLLEEIDSVEPRGGTNLGGGLMAGIQLVRSAGRINGHAQRLILLSDGMANEGITDTTALGKIAAQAVTGEFAISTIGVGLDFNENLMSSLADHGAGNYHFLEALASLDKVLADEFYGASQVLASGMKVKMDLAPGIEVVDASGYPLEKNGTTTLFQPGQLYYGAKKSLYVTLRLPTETTYSKSLGKVELSYHIQGTRHDVSLFDSPVSVTCLPMEKKQEVIGSIKADIYKAAWTENNFGNLLKESAQQVKAGNREEAQKSISSYRAGLNQALASAPATAAPEMRQKISELGKLEHEIDDSFQGANQDEKTKRLSKSYQYQGTQVQRKSN